MAASAERPSDSGRTVRTVNRRMAFTRHPKGGPQARQAAPGYTSSVRARRVQPARQLEPARCDAMPPRVARGRHLSGAMTTPAGTTLGTPRPQRTRVAGAGVGHPQASRAAGCSAASRSWTSPPSSAGTLAGQGLRRRGVPVLRHRVPRGPRRGRRRPSCSRPGRASGPRTPMRPLDARHRPLDGDVTARRARALVATRSRRGATRTRPGGTTPRSRCPPASTSS